MGNYTDNTDVGSTAQITTAMDDYVFVRRPVGYVLDKESIRISTAQITAACRDAGVKSVLIFGPRTYIRASEEELAELAQAYAQGGLKIAIVESHSGGAETAEFFKNAARDGGASVRFFAAIRDAADWLED